jgi:MoaA/NifB/PqqE/SkfB family radical SAM enzyme
MATLLAKAKLLRSLLTGDEAATGPFYVTVDVTRRCNLRCIGCASHSPYVARPTPGGQTAADLSFDLFKSLCDELRALGTPELIFSGEGEPLLHARLPRHAIHQRHLAGRSACRRFGCVAAGRGAGQSVGEFV